MPLEAPPVWATYLDLDADFLPWLNLTNTTGRDSAMTLAMDFACVWVQQFLNRPIASTAITEYMDGGSGMNASYLMLKYFPIIAMTSVSEYRGSGGAFTLTEQTPTSQSAENSYQVDYLTGRLTRTFPGLIPTPWYPGSNNVVAAYTCGYASVPADVKVATLEMAKFWWERSQNPRQSRQNDFGDDGGTDLWPGVPNRVTSLLEPYRNIVIA